MSTSPSTTVHRLVTSLECAGLVAEENDDADRRVVRIRVTGEGRRSLQRIRTLENAFLTGRLAALDPPGNVPADNLSRIFEHLVADA
jgi:DNA-binding MarR family transcriptional regulator